MALSASLANYDIQKLSQEMEKLGGGINIKRESNLAKFVFDPHATQSYAKKDQQAYKELEAAIKKDKLSFSGTTFEYAEETFAANRVVDSLLGKGFNVNVINFSDKGLIFGNDSEFIFTSFTDLQNCHLDYNVQLSLFRVSYDAESNQEFYLDLLNLDYSNPTTNNLRDLNLLKVSNTDELRKLLGVASETDFNFSDNRIFSCYVLCLTLYDEDNRYFSNLMIIDCDIGQYYKEQTKEYAQRFTTDLKLILKEASALKLINIDTLNERIKKKSKISQFFYSSVLKNAKNIVISSLGSESNLDYDLTEIITNFTGFEVICYRSKNISNTYLSSGANICHYAEFMKECQKLRKKSSKSPIRTNTKQLPEKNDTKKKKTDQKGAMAYSDLELEEDIENRKMLANIPQKKVTAEDDPISVEMLEEEEKPRSFSAKAVKPESRGKVNPKENIASDTLAFKKSFVDYKKVHKESNEARKEILKENERLEAEILNIRANYEKEIEGYRHSLMELNEKLHILVDQDKDERLRTVIDAYESDIRRLELQVKSLREQIEILSQVNNQQEANRGGLDLEGTGKLKEMVKVLNLELINKENIISKYKYQEREKENKSFLFEQSQEQTRLLIQENKRLKAENTQIIQQLKDVTDIYDNLKKKNTEIYNEMQEQYMTLLHVTEENSVLRDLVKSKKLEAPQNVNLDESFPRSPKMQKTFSQKASDKKIDAFKQILDDLRETMEVNIKIESKRPVHLLERLEFLYRELNTKYEEAIPKQQKYLDFLGDLQVKMEEYLGKGDELVKKSNKEIRKFLAEVIG